MKISLPKERSGLVRDQILHGAVALRRWAICQLCSTQIPDLEHTLLYYTML